MLQWLIDIDKWVFFAINGYHTEWLDWLMWQFSGGFFWLVALFSIGFLLVKQFGKKGWLLILIAGALFAISDQTSNAFKKYLKRERPTHNPEMIKDINVVADYRGGAYGFYSGHASNSFVLCTFAYFLLRNRLKGAGWLFAFAVLTSYSRIYLGVHYPFDILMGAFVGMALGMGGYLIVRRTKLVPVDSSQ
jgi:undecaprenyl-diphosphatase